TSRLAQETSRLAQETSRLAQETSRLAQETSRVSQETSRLAQETPRLSREIPRLSRESGSLWPSVVQGGDALLPPETYVQRPCRGYPAGRDHRGLFGAEALPRDAHLVLAVVDVAEA